MRYIDPHSKKVEKMGWIYGYISPLGDETSWHERHAIIKKATLTFVVNFL